MEINYTILAIVAVICIVLIVFTIVRNNRDKKELEDTIKQDYHKPRAEDEDVRIDDDKV